MVIVVNDTYENVMSRYDFVYLIEKYMGVEAASYYTKVVHDYDDLLRDRDESINELNEVIQLLDERLSSLHEDLNDDWDK